MRRWSPRVSCARAALFCVWWLARSVVALRLRGAAPASRVFNASDRQTTSLPRSGDGWIGRPAGTVHVYDMERGAADRCE